MLELRVMDVVQGSICQLAPDAVAVATLHADLDPARQNFNYYNTYTMLDVARSV